MGLFDQIENKLDDLVNGVFVRAVKGDLKPVDIASALQRLLVSETTSLGGGRKLAPNAFTVLLNKHDYDRLYPYSKTLNAEIIPTLRDHASTYSLVFNGDISIAYVLDETLPTGKFSATAQTRATVTSQGGIAASPRTDVVTGSTKRPRARTPAPDTGAPHTAAPSTATPDVRAADTPRDPAATSAEAASTDSQPPRVPTSSRVALVLEVNGIRHPLTPPGFTIGRGTEADLRVSDPFITRRHAQIIVDGTPGDLSIRIVDLGSRNGIIVNGEKVLEAQLSRGSRIEIGSTRMLVHASHDES